MIYCPSCDAELAHAMSICPRCGTVLPSALQPSPFVASQPSVSPTSTVLAAPAILPVPPHLHAPQPLSSSMLVLLTSVALLLVLSGVSLIYYTGVAHPAQLRAQATATVRAISTDEAHGTVVANVQATGTAQAVANVTATAQAQVQATATALQAIYTQSTSGPPTLASSLAAQDAANWDSYDTTDGGGCTFTGGGLHASIFSKGYYVPCMAHASNFTNFALQARVTIVRGNEGGLIFRSDDANAKFYAFSIGRDGIYKLFVTRDSTDSLSLAYDNSAAIKTGAGQSNTLTVVARGTSFYLYINQQYVGSASDASYGSGEIGVFASDTSSNTDVAFSNVKVWTLA